MRAAVLTPWLLGACTPGGDGPDPRDTSAEVDSGDSADSGTVDTATLDTGTPEVVLERSGPIVCLGPDRRDEDGPFQTATSPFTAPPATGLTGGGAAAYDADGDGDLDVVGVAFDRLVLWRQDPGRVFVRSEVTGVMGADATAGTFAATPGDLDGDGDLDLVVGGLGVRTTVWRNDGGPLVEVTADSGVGVVDEATPGRHAGASLADVDGDGDLDLFLAGTGPVDATALVPPAAPSRLLLNDGEGVFSEAVGALPASVTETWTAHGLFLDADDDGDPDLWLVNDHAAVHGPSQLLMNDGGTFSPSTAVPALTFDAVSVAVVDVSADGVDDLVSVGPGGVHVWRAGADAWTPGGPLGIALSDGGWPWSVWPGDVDQDGRVDLLVTAGPYAGERAPELPPGPRDELFLQDDAGAFSPAGLAAGAAWAAPTRAGIITDLDRDGWPDLFRVGLAGQARIDWARCGEPSWLTVRVLASTGAPAVGARVTVESGEHVQRGSIRAGGQGFAAAGPPEVQVGLADAKTVDRVTVRWPDGRVDRFDDVLARQILTVRRR